MKWRKSLYSFSTVVQSSFTSFYLRFICGVTSCETRFWAALKILCDPSVFSRWLKRWGRSFCSHVLMCNLCADNVRRLCFDGGGRKGAASGRLDTFCWQRGKTKHGKKKKKKKEGDEAPRVVRSGIMGVNVLLLLLVMVLLLLDW